MAGTRRPKGEGNIYERGAGRWEGYLPYKDMLGRPRKKWFTGHSKREVQSRMNEWRRQHGQGPRQEPSDKPLGQYLAEWLEGDAKRHIRAHVLPSYELYIRLYISPRIGHIALGDLTTAHVQAMLDDLEASGLAPSTATRSRSVLQSALNDALRRGYVLQNVARGARPAPYRRREISYWRPEQTRAFLQAVAGHPQEAYYVLSLTLGLRVSEALGLRWEDVDLEAGTLHVRQAMQRRSVKFPTISDVKSTASYRSVRLSQAAVAALTQHKGRQQAVRDLALREGREWHGDRHGLVFTSAAGYPLAARNMHRQFTNLTHKASLPRIRVHDMRHTAATLMILSGVPIHVVSKTLGHSSIRVTLDIYGHLLDEQKQLVADAMDRLLAG